MFWEILTVSAVELTGFCVHLLIKMGINALPLLPGVTYSVKTSSLTILCLVVFSTLFPEKVKIEAGGAPRPTKLHTSVCISCLLSATSV